MAAPVDIFISFVEEDDALRSELEAHLSALRRTGSIRAWTHRRVAPGEDWRNVLDARLESAKVILLLVSADFLASDYCNDVEVARALARGRAGEARVVVVSVRACDRSLEQLAALDVLPRNRRAVTSWPNRDEAWADVALGLREILGQIAGPQVAAYRKPTPRYPDDAVRELSERVDAARERRRALREAGASTAEVDHEIVALRRQLREGGQLRAGDSLGDGRYLLLDRLGRGGFAVVWRALDRARNERVAIKVLHSELAGDAVRRERFIRGARIMAELAHPAVVRVLEPHGEDGGYHYFVMELITGGDLRRAVLEKRVAGEAVLPIVLKVGDALAKAHVQGYVHRDVKPANILLDEEGEPRLTDFDLVGGAETTGGTRTGALGTVVYAAPELLHRPQDANARADVYGLGMTAVFGLYGKELSLDVVRDAEALIRDQLACDAGGMGSRIKRVLTRAVHWSPQGRFADAASFCEALRVAMARWVPVELADDPDGPAPLSQRVAPGTIVANRYRILRPLGSGDATTMFAAQSLRTGRPVAIKLLDAYARLYADAQDRLKVARFLREARAVGAINSDHVTQVLDVEDDSEHGMVLVFELLEGDSLLDRLNRDGPIPLEELHPIVAQVWMGLVDAHRAGVIHRNIKPSNVFLEHRSDGTTRVKLVDFGIAKVSQEIADSDWKLTTVSQRLGTIAYIPPEQILGAPIDHRVDIYACAMTIYQSLTGRLPYAEGDEDQQSASKLEFEAPRLSEVMDGPIDPRLDAFVARGLGRRREERFPTAIEALAAWQELRPEQRA
ncbi:protein kinase [Sorangium sp. So ce291]|uniref:protein kinase domain-containing protein n=1 Tax=Sorangium sp. So ce291 TaxID=3133294 RepID=UPI003F64055F